MPHEWNNMLVVTKEELIPAFVNTENTLWSTIRRYETKSYGIKRVQRGGNGREMYILYDSLPSEIKEGLGDPRKCDHVLERFYKIDGEAVSFYGRYKFPDSGLSLDMAYQEQYIINASVIKALFALKSYREGEWKTKKRALTGIMATICSDAVSFNKTLWAKHKVQHSLPESEKRIKEALKAFEKTGYESIISKRHGNDNSRKVTERTFALLNAMFAGNKIKPTATEVYRTYESFMNGYTEVLSYDKKTGEIIEEFSPMEFKKLSDTTVKVYMTKWESKIGNYAARSGDRQKYLNQFKPSHSFDKPKYAGSIISVDDRNPPFKALNGKRIWFYNAYDVGAEVFTAWVYGESKEGIVKEFYRQIIRNYALWNLNIPAELEAERSLNASFTDTFLREGAMFEYVHIEPNNARAKYIERVYGSLRYSKEKDRVGWLARPNALSESNQSRVAIEKVPMVPYQDIVEGCLRDIEDWNNGPHSVHTHMSRWEVFMQMQHPDLKPTNYAAVLPHIGRYTKTSCNVGRILLNNKKYLLGNDGYLSTGNNLINLMKLVEGRDLDIYWLDGHDGEIIKALVYLRGQTQLICEAILDPKYQRARKERTGADDFNLAQMSSYATTIESYGLRQKNNIDQIITIDHTPKPVKTFIMPGSKQLPVSENADAEMLPPLPIEDTEYENVPATGFVRSLADTF